MKYGASVQRIFYLTGKPIGEWNFGIYSSERMALLVARVMAIWIDFWTSLDYRKCDGIKWVVYEGETKKEMK